MELFDSGLEEFEISDGTVVSEVVESVTVVLSLISEIFAESELVLFALKQPAQNKATETIITKKMHILLLKEFLLDDLLIKTPGNSYIS